MNILLTFDVEVWCNSWATLEQDFPDCFERYVYGRSPQGDYALPKTLEILDRYDLRGIFFVEPLFAARFGIEPLAKIVELIKQAGQEIQLHLHPEWTDEAITPLLPNITKKRQHLSYYSKTEQTTLIAHGLRLLKEAGTPDPCAFRSGSFACNEDTFAAVEANGLRFDSSINRTYPISKPGKVQPEAAGLTAPFKHGKLEIYPMSIFRDGLGKLRHAQIGACSSAELIQAITQAEQSGYTHFVILSHNFEMMKPGKAVPDKIVTRRFEELCQFLSRQHLHLSSTNFNNLESEILPSNLTLPHTNTLSTCIRHAEQFMRKII